MPPRPRLSLFARQRVWQLLSEGHTCTIVAAELRREGIITTRQTVWRLERHIRAHRTLQPRLKPGRPLKLLVSDMHAIDHAMEEDDETTGKELMDRLQWNGVSVSKRTVYRAQRNLGWTSRGTAYCQLIRAPNRAKHLEWAKKNLGNSFEHVIWLDETKVQLETHRRFCCWKRGQKPRYKPRLKHPTKVHVWAGISWRGTTRVCVFQGIMDAELYITILEVYLLPFI